MVTQQELEQAIRTLTLGLDEVHTAGLALLTSQKAWKEARAGWTRRLYEASASLELARIILREPKMIPTSVSIEQAVAMATESMRKEDG